MRHFTTTTTLVLALITLGGCRGAAPATGRAIMPHLAGGWRLVAIDGHKLPASFAANPPTLTIEREGKVQGFAGVNSYSGEIDVAALDDGVFAIDGVGARTALDGSREWRELETHYLRRLEDADAAIVRGSTLDLTEGDEPSLTYKRAKGKRM